MREKGGSALHPLPDETDSIANSKVFIIIIISFFLPSIPSPVRPAFALAFVHLLDRNAVVVLDAALASRMPPGDRVLSEAAAPVSSSTITGAGLVCSEQTLPVVARNFAPGVLEFSSGRTLARPSAPQLGLMLLVPIIHSIFSCVM
jgi:hypothetical protein